MTTDPTLEPPARLVAAVDVARAAAVADAVLDLGPIAAATAVGEHLEAVGESPGGVTHYFIARQDGYRGWRWSVTLASGERPHTGASDGTDPAHDRPGDDHPADDPFADGGPAASPITVSEVVLLPGAAALVAPVWLPWEQRIRPGDLGVGDLLPTTEGDDRLVPGYLASDDTAVEDLAAEVGLGRPRVLSRAGRDDATQRWSDGPHGPGADMARAAPGPCGTCGFYLPLAGSLRGAFGVCGNAYAPADGAVVAVGFGCGAHSDTHVELVSPVAVAELVYDDGVDLEPVVP